MTFSSEPIFFTVSVSPAYNPLLSIIWVGPSNWNLAKNKEKTRGENNFMQITFIYTLTQSMTRKKRLSEEVEYCAPKHMLNHLRHTFHFKWSVKNEVFFHPVGSFSLFPYRITVSRLCFFFFFAGPVASSVEYQLPYQLQIRNWEHQSRNNNNRKKSIIQGYWVLWFVCGWRRQQQQLKSNETLTDLVFFAIFFFFFFCDSHTLETIHQWMCALCLYLCRCSCCCCCVCVCLCMKTGGLIKKFSHRKDLLNCTLTLCWPLHTHTYIQCVI